MNPSGEPIITPAAEGITRRQWLAAAAASGAALAGTAWGAEKIGGVTASVHYEQELAKLRALLTLYEQLERVGLDTVLTAGMNTVRVALQALQTGARLLRDGITAAENALKAFQTTLDQLRPAADAAAQMLADLDRQFRAAEALVGGALGTAQPLADSIGGFFKSLVDKIPFGIGDAIRRALDTLIDLIRAIPRTVEGLNTRLFKPLNEGFFLASGDAPVKTGLVDPITRNLLQPLKPFLAEAEALFDRWEKDFTAPVQSALDRRSQIRQEIADYRRQNNMS